MSDRTLLVILTVLILVWTSFMTVKAVEFAHIQQEIARIVQRSEEQHQNFLRNQATILRDNDRMFHEHDAQARDHRAILQRLAH